MTNWIYNEDGTIEPHSVHWKKNLSQNSYRKWDNRTKKFKYITCGSEEHKQILKNKGTGRRVIIAPIQVDQSIASKWYLSTEWKTCRKKYLCEYYKSHKKRTCNSCGKCEDEVKMHVDHIYPVRRYWNMRLDQNNLQNMCEMCNLQKGNSMESDNGYVATRRLIKKNGKFIILELNEKPFICPDWMKDSAVSDQKDKNTPVKPSLQILSIKKLCEEEEDEENNIMDGN